MIPVQLQPDGPITQMDEAQLEKREGVLENEHELTRWVEYWLPGTTDRAVHRSVHVHLKQGLGIEAVLGRLN